jgi:transcriptional activator of comK gene
MIFSLRLKFLWLILLIVLLVIVAGCFMLSHPIPQDQPSFKVGLLVEGNIYDQGWDSEAYAALIQIERNFDAETEYIEFHNQGTEESFESQAKRLAEEGFDLIFGHGRIFEKPFNKLGPKYPDTTFVFFNGNAEGENVFSVSFTPVSMGFFAGMTAGLMTKSGVVGIVAALPDMEEIKGFQAGVRYANPSVKVLTETVGSWGDREKGKMHSLNLIKQGADVLFGAGDGFNIEVINAAREKGVYAVGFVSDQSFISRETVLVSIIQNVRKVYLDIARKTKYNELGNKHEQVYDFTNGGQRLTNFGDMVPEEVQAKIRQALEQYRLGNLGIS